MGIDPKQQEPHLSGAYIHNLVKQLTSSNTKESMTKLDQSMSSENPNPQPHKKQVRRRLHTSRPYQERLLNMAEARREIVTALKLHRASMKQANEQHKHEDEHQQHQPLLQVQPPPPPPQQCSGYLENPSYGSLSYPPPMIFPTADFQLPNQPLGLNLNFQDFTNLDTNSPPSVYSPSVPVHQAMDDEEVAEMRSIGDQHQMEWNDAMNLVTSARWFKFLKTMEIEPEEVKAQDFGSLHPFDEAMEIPSWLNPGDVCFQQQFGGFSSNDPDLPWMDIGDIDGTDGDGLS